MFTPLHALAKQATLMITIVAEGDDQLRVNVTPMPFDSNSKAKLPQPLSLVATPAEFDADFATALSTWQAPKRSLVEQALAAADGAAETVAAPVLPAPKAGSKNEKPGRKAARGKAGSDQPGEGEPAAGDVSEDRAKSLDQIMAVHAAATAPGQLPVGDDVSEEGAAGEAAAGVQASQATVPAPVVDVAPPADTLTLDLF